MRKNKLRILMGVIFVCGFLCSTAVNAMGNKDTDKTAAKTESEQNIEKIVFEDSFEKDLQGWSGRASEVLKIVENNASDGKKSLQVSERTSTWNGPIKDITAVISPGKSYKIGLWFLYEEGPEKQDIMVSLERTLGSSKDYINIGGASVPRGDWTYIECQYSVPVTKNPAQYRLYVETKYKQDDQATKDDLIPFYIDDVRIIQLPPPRPAQVETDIPSFYTLFKDLPVGAAINSIDLDSTKLHNGLLRHFNVFVYENEMKPESLQPAEGRFVFEKADALVSFAQKQKVKLRGHTLVWHNQTPKWFFQDSQNPGAAASKDLLFSRMENHIKTIVGRYKGKIDSWDVVNEVIEDNGNLRNSAYLKIAGSDEYIRNAFKWAREADPAAKLFINDYNIEFRGPKQDALYNLVKTLKAEGVPIDGVGLQAHINVGFPTVNDIRNAIRRFASLGVKVQITELDVSIYGSGSEPKKEADREILLEQAYKYRDLFKMFQEEAAAGNLDMVVLWGLSDDRTWLNNFPVPGRTDYPLLFGKDLRAKPAYWAIVNPDKLPIGIKNIIAYQNESLNPADPIYSYINSTPIVDQKGITYGSFKATWNGRSVMVLATVLDNSPDAGDAVTMYLEPKNRRLEKKSDELISISVPRSKATQDSGSEYTVFAEIPFTPKLESKVGFDIKIQNGSAKGISMQSWNDFTNNQEKGTVNYGTLSMKQMPRTLDVKRGSITFSRNKDPIWDTIEPIPMTVKTMGVTEEGSTFKVLWDENYLYVLMEIKDELLSDKNSNPWEQDSVEVFIDQNNGKTTSYEADDAQYRVNYRNVKSFNGGDEERFQSISRIVLGGYWVQMAVPFTHIKPEAGLILGFDVQINEADATGSRIGIRNWHNDTNLGYKDPSGLGIVKLVE